MDGLRIIDAADGSSLAASDKQRQQLELLLNQTGSLVGIRLDKQSSEFSIDNLKPYTVYQIQMFAYNSLGRSQLTDPIRALTLAPESEPTTSGSASNEPEAAYVEPQLPDTRKCCLDRGVTLKR